jgi:hypothetical protein
MRVAFMNASDPKGFVINLSFRVDRPAFAQAAIVLGQALRCADPQYGEGGGFTTVSAIHNIERDPDPTCIWASGFDASHNQPQASINLAAAVHAFASGSALFYMTFADTLGWRHRESEELVGATMDCVDLKMDLLFQFPPGDRWVRTSGAWRHGAFFKSG